VDQPTDGEKMTAPLLEVRNLVKSFGGVKALDDVSFCVESREIVGVIGPNGSGKTTMLHCLSGALVPDAGEVRFLGKDVTGSAPFRITRMGISRSFQSLEDFPTLTVLDHLLLATQWRRPHLGRTNDDQAARQTMQELALEAMADRPAGDLSYGQRKLLGIGMARMQRPRLVLLDEPTAGVNPSLADAIGVSLATLGEGNQSVVLIEHNIPLVMKVAHRLIVMSSGRIIADGEPEDVRASPAVREAYFGR
jgi:branched-chain amino acid transport system ATP-binding protein